MNKNEDFQTEQNLHKVKQVIEYAKQKDVVYNAKQFESGYHSLHLGDQYLRGQRECRERLDKLNYDFSGKNVLDIGTNIGGMLFSIQKEINYGIGIDNEPKYINAANSIKRYNGYKNIDFFLLDLQIDPLDILDNLILVGNIDIIFLLSVCMWIDNWKDIILYCSKKAPDLFFETNGTNQQQLAQIDMLKKFYRKISVVNMYSDDDSGQINRSTLFCSNK
ncbi:MAG: methyltransferase domain-containing protein [Candidatus Margulisiibacteriota bacterium]